MDQVMNRKTADIQGIPIMDMGLGKVVEDYGSVQSDSTQIVAKRDRALVPYDALQLYMQEVKRYNLLSREEELELATRVGEGNDQEASNRLVTSNLRLVVKIAMDFHRYWRRGLMDLIQEGNIGLLQAVNRFDPYRGIKFSYYASFWIKAYILKFIMESWKLVKIGTTKAQRKLFYNLNKERDKLLAEGLVPEPRLLAERLDVKVRDVEEMSVRLKNGEVSIDSPVDDEGRESFGSILSDPQVDIVDRLSDAEGTTILKEKLMEFRKPLSERDVDIFDSRIMSEEPLTLRELGESYRISRERVRQIQKRIIENAKIWLTNEISNFEEEYTIH